MATILPQGALTPNSERAFFFYMAIAIAVTAVTGFGFFIAIGQSHFTAPWWVHIHAITMMGWVSLYLLQNGLVWTGNVRFHRQLGLLGAAWAIWLPIVGISITAMSLHAGRAPPFFDPAFFLAMDWLGIVGFAALSWTGLIIRQRQDWHKRLMLSGTLVVIAPAWGRLLPLPLLGNLVIWPIMVVLLLYFGAAMIFDLRKLGRVHPAYYWGVGVHVGVTLLIPAFAVFPPLVAFATALTA